MMAVSGSQGFHWHSLKPNMVDITEIPQSGATLADQCTARLGITDQLRHCRR